MPTSEEAAECQEYESVNELTYDRGFKPFVNAIKQQVTGGR